MTRYRHAFFLAGLAASLAACGGGSGSAVIGASNRPIVSAVDAGTGIKASGVCNGNPDAGAVGNISGLVDGDAATYFGAKAIETDSGGIHHGEAVVDCTVTVDFSGSPPSADYAELVGTVTGSWHDNNANFYYYEGLNAVANVYTLSASGQKTLLTSGEEEIEPHCVGETVQSSNQTTCGFAVFAGNSTANLPVGTTSVEFDIHFFTVSSATTCFTTCTAVMEPHLTGVGVVKSGVGILATGS